MFEKWLPRMAFVLEGFSSFKGKRREEGRRSTNMDKRYSKTANISASWNVKEMKQMQSNHCLLADGTHRKWNCPLFKNMCMKNWYAAVRKQRLCYGCLGKRHAIRDCRIHVCGVNECIKKYNRLPIATLRNPNGQRQSRSQRKHSNNQPEQRTYELPSDSSCLNTERWQQAEHIFFLR